MISSWIAELDGQIVGHVAISEPQPGDDAVRLWLEQSDDTVDKVAVVGRLFVTKAARRKAIGEKLARAVVTDPLVRGKRLVLDVMDKDQDAIRLYERLGLQKIGTATHTFGEGQTITAHCYVVPEIP
nr:GNAT family N-acetyltransferase [Kribbella italica]